MRKRYYYVFYAIFLTFALALALAPVLLQITNPTSFLASSRTLALFNLVAWILVLVMIAARIRLKRAIEKRASIFGIEVRFKSIEELLVSLLHEIGRKNDSFSINLIQQQIVSKEELSRALERVVAQAYRLLKAQSAELALFDEESGLYHSAFVLGKPFKVSAQAMLSDAAKTNEEPLAPDVVVQPVAFAGSMLGTLRVGLKKGRLPSISDREVMNLLALQAGLALMNAKYSEQLVRMKQSSEESVRAKTGFLANLSHEIRGPLGIMLNAVELVLDGLCGEINKDQLDTLRMVHSNGQHLLDLINDVLDYAKVESGRITPKKSTIAVGDLLDDLAGVVRSQAEMKNHKLVSLAAEEDLAFQCDRRHARQMLINLLTNAVKYTPDGGRIEMWAERSPGNKIKINIKDTGVGIEPEDRHKVFAAFERIENAYAIKQVGTGLGMPLTKKLCEVNGGTIDFESIPEHGTTFWLIFPAAEGDTDSVESADDQIPEVDGKGNRVLLVERDEGERSMISRYLTHIGFCVMAAGTKIEALDALRESEVDIAVVGNNVADTPEEDVVAMIRENAKSPALPLVLVSSRAFVFDIERYLKAGVDRCLVKPIKLKDLGFSLRQLIDGTYEGEVVDSETLDMAESKPAKHVEDQSSESQAYKTTIINANDIH